MDPDGPDLTLEGLFWVKFDPRMDPAGPDLTLEGHIWVKSDPSRGHSRASRASLRSRMDPEGPRMAQNRPSNPGNDPVSGLRVSILLLTTTTYYDFDPLGPLRGSF